MASKGLLLVLMLLVALLPNAAMANTFAVGDEMGWSVGFDYGAWAQGKEFHVGDELVFRYPAGAHNVYEVDESEFKECVVPASSLNDVLDSGSDVVTLATPGTKWYICGVGRHCEFGGQKLSITVQSVAVSPAKAPSPKVSPPTMSRTTVSASTSTTMAPPAISIVLSLVFLFVTST